MQVNFYIKIKHPFDVFFNNNINTYFYYFYNYILFIFKKKNVLSSDFNKIIEIKK